MAQNVVLAPTRCHAWSRFAVRLPGRRARGGRAAPAQQHIAAVGRCPSRKRTDVCDGDTDEIITISHKANRSSLWSRAANATGSGRSAAKKDTCPATWCAHDPNVDVDEDFIVMGYYMQDANRRLALFAG